MANAFTQWLSQAGSSYQNGNPILKDFQHASRLYVDDTYARSPKFGFLYFVAFNINSNAIVDENWKGKLFQKDVGFLVKRIDLPKFQISAETLNQYNRKTVVQTKLNYQPVSIDFHDDNSDITNNLWINYYKFHYNDSLYGDSTDLSRKQNIVQYKDTKFGEIDYKYGRKNYKNLKEPFFTSIDIYVMHQQQFTQITLINPKITEWTHDSLDQSNDTKILQNKMTLMYENVLYNRGYITKDLPEGFTARYYDNAPSPYSVAGYGIKDVTGTIPGSNAVYGKPKSTVQSPILDIGKILLKNVLNKKGLGKLGPVGYNIAGSILSNIGSAGKNSEPPPSSNQPGILNLPGGIGINVFKGLNTTSDGKIRANPAAIIFPKK